MTQEEKARAYDEAVKIARCWLNDPQTIQDCNYTIEDAIQNIFPQLRESEDERVIRTLYYLVKDHDWLNGATKCEALNWLEKQKESLHISESCKENANSFTSEDERMYEAIISLLKEFKNSGTLWLKPTVQLDDAISFIEKQKEHHIPWYDYQKSKEAGYTIVPNEEYEQLIKQKEQKPAEWNKATINGEPIPTENHSVDIPLAEWSEEDEDMLNSCISSIEEAKENRYAYKETDGDTSYDHEIAWLKSIRPS